MYGLFTNVETTEDFCLNQIKNKSVILVLFYSEVKKSNTVIMIAS